MSVMRELETEVPQYGRRACFGKERSCGRQRQEQLQPAPEFADSLYRVPGLRAGRPRENAMQKDKLFAKIGELTMERDFLANALGRFPAASAKR